MIFKQLVISASLVIFFLAGLAFFSPPQPALACIGTGSDSDVHLLGIIPPWHHYLDCDTNGGVSNEIELNDTWLIALAVFEGIVRISGLLAVVFIIWGGVKYMTSQGSPEGTANARKTILNAVVGLVIAISASVVVPFVFDLLSGGAANNQAAAGDDGSGALIRVLNLVYAITAIAAVIYVTIGAIKFATSTGDPGKAASARNSIIYALVGLAVILLARTITQIVVNEVTGYDIQSTQVAKVLMEGSYET